MLGYRFQPLYALLVLWQESEDDLDEITVESDDDVVLKSNYTKLYQLKHSTGKSGSLTVKNDGFWKTIRIWAPYADSSDHKFYFVTGDSVDSTSLLHKLVTGDLDRRAIVKLIMDEAKLVIDARSKAITNKANKIPYESKIHGCEAFINLSPKQRSALIEKITIRPSSFNISQVHGLVIDKLGQTVIKKLRPLIAQRLLEWWDYRMLHTSKVNKSELLIQLQYFIAQTQDNNLPDDFSRLKPASADSELGGFMEKQIDLVNGGKSRKRKAAVARWRARNQRERWITDDVINAIELKEYDDLLVESWGNRHEPMKEDLEGESEDLCEKRGLELLDWVHDDSHLHIHPIRSEWKQLYMIHGSFQQLSEELKVGWHPKYYEMLRID